MKKWIILLLLLVAAAGGWYYYDSQLQQDAHPGQDITDLSNAWQDEGLYQAALAKLKANPPIEPALVLTPEKTGARRIAIVFDGMGARGDMAKIVDLLNKYNMKAIFFIEGQNGGDNPEILRIISEGGQEIGNYTFAGSTQIEKLSQEDLLQDLCRSQNALMLSGAQSVKYFNAARSQYNDSVLQAVHAAGMDFAVKPNVYFNPNSLHTPADADAFVASVPLGSILAIQIGTPVDAVVNEPGKTDEKPAVDKQPTIVDNPPAQPGPPREKLIDEIERLLDALARAQVKVESAGTFRQIKYVPAVPAPAAPPAPGVNKK